MATRNYSTPEYISRIQVKMAIDRARRIIDTNTGDDGAERRIRLDARKTLRRLERQLNDQYRADED